MENIENGFEYNGVWIENPYMSECGRFDVDPITYYGLTEKQLDEITKTLKIPSVKECGIIS